MEKEISSQPNWGPPDKPLVKNPVKVTMDIPIYYSEAGGFTLNKSIICGEAFADTVLKECEKILQVQDLALVHLGFYNPRKARRKDGSIIKPVRWSNHAYGEAVDFKGVIKGSGEGDFLGIAEMESTMPETLKKIVESCERAIIAAGRKPEIVHEGDWYHIGLWPL
jgi:hypothetical protein